ncbi:hypothetical protein [Anaerospora hongkongensis]|uniref:hypothetical protein n=1 Tax=Anaerospora hongkongensis TaxID=244830 RepID=UPI002FD99605
MKYNSLMNVPLPGGAGCQVTILRGRKDWSWCSETVEGGPQWSFKRGALSPGIGRLRMWMPAGETPAGGRYWKSLIDICGQQEGDEGRCDDIVAPPFWF